MANRQPRTTDSDDGDPPTAAAATAKAAAAPSSPPAPATTTTTTTAIVGGPAEDDDGGIIITTYISPMTKRLHHDIEENSPSRIRRHNAESLRASRKNMMNNIDYIISIGDFEEDPQAAMLFDKMEKSIQKIKLEFQQLNLKLLQPKTPPRKG